MRQQLLRLQLLGLLVLITRMRVSTEFRPEFGWRQVQGMMFCVLLAIMCDVNKIIVMCVTSVSQLRLS
jgi:hypothetical protein